MSYSAETVLTFSALTCQADQFMSDSAEILIFAQKNSLQNRPTFRRIQTALQSQIFSLGKGSSYIVESTISVSALTTELQTVC